MSVLTHELPGIPLGERIGSGLLHLLERMVRNSGRARSAAYAARLHELSDAELASRGIRREDIVRVAFARYLHY